MANPKPAKQVFKVEAEGDTLYIDAPTREDAQLVLDRRMGYIPSSILTWSGPMPLPADEEALA